MMYGGLRYEIEYSQTHDSEQGKAYEFIHSNLPTELVCGLVTESYRRPEIKQQVLDALSNFQILSKQWACTVLHKIIADDYERSPIVYVGSWFGQLNSLLARRIPNYAQRNVTMIDLDPVACEVAQNLINMDTWQAAFKQNISIVCGDALNFDLAAYSDEHGADPIVIWTGIEHFDRRAVKEYIKFHASDCNALYLLQGTNMPAPDHPSPIAYLDELEKYFDGEPIYSARLKTAIGDRFQTVFATK